MLIVIKTIIKDASSGQKEAKHAKQEFRKNRTELPWRGVKEESSKQLVWSLTDEK